MIATATEIDSKISEALQAKSESDYTLAGALFELWRNQYYRAVGYRSVAEYLRERFRDTDQDAAARMHARGFQRLIREFKLAQEIPVFRESFDKISRSNRRLLAQVITRENAADWITKAKSMTYRDLEDLVAKLPADRKQNVLARKVFQLYSGQLETVQRALETAAKLLEQDGGDPRGAESARLETICQEFLATYEASPDGYRTVSYMECPACGKFGAMHRRPEEDRPVDDGRILVFQGQECQHFVLLKSF